MHLVDDHGRAMEAEYHVEADDGHLALIMESRSGMSGTQAPRNSDYNRALTILLARLTIFNSGGYRVWSPGAWCGMPEA